MDLRGATGRAALRAADAARAASSPPAVRGRQRARLPVPALRGRGGPGLARLRGPGAMEAAQLHDGRRAPPRALGHAPVRGWLAHWSSICESLLVVDRMVGRCRRLPRPSAADPPTSSSCRTTACPGAEGATPRNTSPRPPRCPSTWPDPAWPPARPQALASTIDIAPTLAELGGVDLATGDGQSLVPALHDPAAPGRDEMLEIMPADPDGFYEGWAALRTPELALHPLGLGGARALRPRGRPLGDDEPRRRRTRRGPTRWTLDSTSSSRTRGPSRARGWARQQRPRGQPSPLDFLLHRPLTTLPGRPQPLPSPLTPPAARRGAVPSSTPRRAHRR